MMFTKRTSLILLLLFLAGTSVAVSQAMLVDFKQAANNRSPNSLGNVYWINSILQHNNSVYNEGMSVPQRIMLTNVPSRPMNMHTLTFSHQASKNGKHAYDFITSYDQARTAASAIAGPTTLVNLNECGPATGPPNSTPATCASIRSGPHSFTVNVPDAMGTVLNRNVATRVTNYEARFGNRTIKIYGNAAIFSASLSFAGYGSGKEAVANYTLSWSSASTVILVEFATHLAMGLDAAGAGTGVGYGSGLGAGSIPGGSYHVRLGSLNGGSLGNRDNQIMGGAVGISIACNVGGPDIVCTGSQNLYAFNTSERGYTYSWSLSNNTSGASIVGSTTSQAVTVAAGSQQGAYIIAVTVSDGTQTVTCPFPVTVNGINASANPTPILCYGSSSEVTVAATGGRPPYQGTGKFNRGAGKHDFPVTDANGCTTLASVTIAEPPPCTISAVATPILCPGGTSTVTVTAAGGTPPYIGTGTFVRTAGTYSFTISDANNCVATASVTITEPGQFTVAASASPIPCSGGTSTVTVTASGGTPPYTGTGSFSKAAGTYTFTVTDANGCSATSASLTITAPPQLTATSTATSVPCNTGNSTITVDATGGTPPYAGTGTFSRPAGTYNFTVTDVNNCTATTTVTVLAGSSITVTANATPILCPGGTSTVTVAASGGTAPYTGTGMFTRGAGIYTFIVTDANNCSGSATVTITEPGQFTVAASATPILCSGGTSTVTVTASGGTPPYTGTGSFSKAAGTYTFTVTDANGCSATSASLTITAPPQLTASASATPIPCGTGLSTVTVTASGGTPPLTGTGTFSRPAGTHIFTVTDANNCVATTTVTITGGAAISVTATATPILCGGAASAVTVAATGGTAPYSGTGVFSRGAGTYTFIVTDANNCSGSATVTITEPPGLLAASTATPILCTGGTSTVTVAATGGTPPYTGTGAFTRGAGIFTFTVTDANNCTATTTATITEPPTLTAAATGTPILCYGTTSTVTVTASGGTAPYTGTGSFSRTAGTYSFTVTDANGCTATASLSITQPPQLAATSSATAVVCNSGNATVTVSATGGTAPYTGTGVFSRPAGTYTFTVTDANNCSATTSVTITGSSSILVTSAAAPILCNGGTSAVTVTATGGTAPYTGTGVFTRGAGTHIFTVTDANSCSSADTITISEPPALLATSNATPILCNGGTSTVTVAASGGTPPYTGTGVFTRGAGIFTFTVTDANNCTATTTATITEPPTITATASATPILCNGSTSTVTVAASGGTAPYTGTGSFSRTAGTYSFTVTDANSCTATVSVSITQPPTLTASSSATPILCNSGNSTVTVSATGGTPPYSGTGTFSRPAGTYTFTVTDANNCSSTTTITIIGASSIIATASATPILCNGGTSTVTVAATGGTAPYTGTGAFTRGAGTFTFIVTDANNCSAVASVTITEPPALSAASSATPILCNGTTSTVTVTASGGTAPYTGTGVFSRGGGTYNFTVTDANNCTATTSVTIVEPPQLTVSATAPQILCNGSTTTITVSATGGTAPYTGTGIFVRSAGTYTFTVTDANNCSASASITLTQPPTLSAASVATPILCNGGTSTVTVTVTGGTPPYTGTGAFVRSAGTYTFTVSDGNNCTATTSVTITQPPALTVSASMVPILCNGDTATVTITASGGTAPYTGSGTFRRTAGNYTFTVTDANSCTASTQVLIVQPPELIAAVNFTPILCTGDTSTVDVTATGGTPPYSGTGRFSRRTGSFDFIVVDANGCRDTVSLTLTEPPLLIASHTATPILCYGGLSTVTVTATGGTPPYTGVGNVSRPAGTHILTVTDANGCLDTTVVVLTQPPALIATSTAPPILCNGGTTTITVGATGGTPPYTGTGAFTRATGTYSFPVTDANGCTATTTISIPDPPLLAASVFATPIRCFGDTSIVTVTAYGGTQPYSGTGIFRRGPGTFNFIVVDVNGCTANVSVHITEPPLLLAASSATPILCNGGNSTVTVTASGGTPPYTGTGVFSRPAGTYTFTVLDSNNCAATTSITITQPPALIVTASAAPVGCNGDSTTVTVNVSGGTPPYTGAGSFRRLAGNYSFTVTDANSCTATAQITVTQPPTLEVDVLAAPILCFGDTSTVDVTATGGTPPYTGIGSFGRRAGTWIFTVSDANGCIDADTITLVEPPLLVASVSATTILCYGGQSTVTVTATGGTPPYSGVGNFSRPAGTHTFVVTDANGCLDVKIITITEPPQLVAASTATPILCKGGLTTITVTASGGTQPYTGTGTFSRNAGTYTFTITDANGCTAQTVISIPDPPQLFAGIFATPILCYGDTSIVTVSAYGGTAPYSGTGLFPRGPGTFTFTVTDANGCTASTQVTIAEPPPLLAASTAPPILCNGGTTTVTVTASGGTPPYRGVGVFSRPAGTHLFTVSDTNGCIATTSITIIEPPLLVAAATAPPVSCSYENATVTVTASGGTPAYNGVGTFSRPIGTHNFLVTDANGCTANVSITIVGPPPLVAAAVATPILCNGGMSNVTVTATGGTPPYIGTGTYIRGAGYHTFIVRDINNCADTVSISIFEPPPLVLHCDVTPCDPVTNTRTINSAVHGGTPPYTFSWSPGNSNMPTFTVPCHDTQTYTLVVYDANWNPSNQYNAGCLATCSISLVGFKGDDPVDEAVARHGDTGRGQGGADDAELNDATFGTQKSGNSHAADEYALFENYPNPFNPSTTIKYYVPEASQVRLTIHNTYGQVVATLVDDAVETGTHSAIWNARTSDGASVPSGSYFYRIQAKSMTSKREFVRERMMLLLK